MAATTDLRASRKQRGDAMIEALIAVVLLGVVGLGLTFALGRTIAAQKFHKAQSLTVQGIRADVQSGGVASGCPATGNASQSKTLVLSPTVSVTGVTKECTVTPVTVSINGVDKAVTLTAVRYSVEAETLLGPGTLTLSN